MPHEAAQPQPGQKHRNRIIGLRWIAVESLRPNPRNWRNHPESQRNALRAVLAEIGFADALLARQLADGGLELIDGHLRAETVPDRKVPVLVLDVSEDEANRLLAVHDPLAEMAGVDKDAMQRLFGEVETSSAALREMLDITAAGAGVRLEHFGADASEAKPKICPECGHAFPVAVGRRKKPAPPQEDETDGDS